METAIPPFQLVFTSAHSEALGPGWARIIATYL
jgi:hypothetical protein